MIMITMMTVTMIVMMAVIMITMKMVTVDKQTNEQNNKTTTEKTPCTASEEVQINKNKGSEVFAAKFCWNKKNSAKRLKLFHVFRATDILEITPYLYIFNFGRYIVDCRYMQHFMPFARYSLIFVSVSLDLCLGWQYVHLLTWRHSCCWAGFLLFLGLYIISTPQTSLSLFVLLDLCQLEGIWPVRVPNILSKKENENGKGLSLN